MRRFHALSTMLLGGWLVMTPPYVCNPKPTTEFPNGRDCTIDIDSDPVQWKHLFAFDTARECEAALGDEHDAQKNAEGCKAAHPHDAADCDIWGFVLTRARCIPADHVYPPQPATPPKK